VSLPRRAVHADIVVFSVTIFSGPFRQVLHGPTLERPQMFRVALLVLFICAPALARDNGQYSQARYDAPGGGV
jgi:hypothetical protein